jgi:hypothetical protein
MAALRSRSAVTAAGTIRDAGIRRVKEGGAKKMAQSWLPAFPEQVTS